MANAELFTDRSFVDPHARFAAEGAYRSGIDSVQRCDVFHFCFVPSKLQDFLHLSLCESGVNPHFSFSAEHLYVDWVDIVSRCNVVQLRFVFPEFHNLVNLFQRKFSLRAFSHVLGTRKWLQVVGVDAAFYVAEMVKLQFGRHRSDEQIIEVPMCAPAASEDFRFAISQKPVASPAADMSLPYPARRTVASIFQDKRVGQFLSMAVDVIFRLAFFVSRSLFSPLRDCRFLTTAALAKTITHTGTLPSTSLAWGGV